MKQKYMFPSFPLQRGWMQFRMDDQVDWRMAE
jgi:hypothetical protein